VLKLFKLKADTVVAGSMVQTGTLKKTRPSSATSASTEKGKAKSSDTTSSSDVTTSYFFKVLRKGEIILERNAGDVDLKRFKDSVQEVRETAFVLFFPDCFYSS
jgi:hypothetical protein